MKYRLSLNDYGWLLGLLVVGTGAAFFEGLGIAIFFPILQTAEGFQADSIPFPINVIFEYFEGFSFGERIRIIAGLLVLIHLMRVFCIYVSTRIALVIRARFVKFYKMSAVRQVMRVGMNYFNKRRVSDLQKLFEHNIEVCLGAVVEILATAVPMVLTAIGLVTFLFFFSWKTTLVAIVFVTIASSVLGLLIRRVQDAGENLEEAKSKTNKILFDILQGMKIIRLFGAEEKLTNSFDEQIDGVNTTYSRMASLTKLVGPLFEAIGIILVAAILFFGSVFITQDSVQATLAILLTFLIIIARLIPPLKTINHARGAISARVAAIKELKEFLKPDDKEFLLNGKRPFNSLQEKIEFENLHFGYDPQKAIVLHDLNFVIEKGTKIGIVGASGAGKSTVAELLLRFYDPQKGQISIDGINLVEWELVSWRKRIGVVSQDTFLFYDTIKANIAFSSPEASDDAIIQAARWAHAHDFIEKLPQGYETRIGERGVLLSGGQRQRLAIARAILCEPEILIFDEATSALDTTSEKIVQEALDDVAKGRTVITIAHRLDKIVVLDQGSVVECGSPKELMALDGIYKRFVGKQTLEV